MRIGFFELEGWEGDVILKHFPDAEIYLSEDKIDPLNLPKENDFEIISVFSNSRIDKKVLEHFPNLKFITTRSTGFDHIDIKACAAKGIKVAHVPGYGSNTVAEFTFGLILNLTRKIYHAIDQVKEMGSFSLNNLRGIDLKGRTLGIIGAGRIGKEVIKIAKGFSMEVVATDIYPNEEFAREVGFEYLTLKELLKRSDVITIHCPYNKETHHLINKENINLIKKGTFLVNTARGGIIETEALVEALQKGILAGAGLDVLEEEGEVKEELSLLTKTQPEESTLRAMLYNHILMEMPNVLITPHNAFNSQGALERILRTTIENINAFKEGKPVNLVPWEI